MLAGPESRGQPSPRASASAWLQGSCVGFSRAGTAAALVAGVRVHGGGGGGCLAGGRQVALRGARLPHLAAAAVLRHHVVQPQWVCLLAGALIPGGQQQVVVQRGRSGSLLVCWRLAAKRLLLLQEMQLLQQAVGGLPGGHAGLQAGREGAGRRRVVSGGSRGRADRMAAPQAVLARPGCSSGCRSALREARSRRVQGPPLGSRAAPGISRRCRQYAAARRVRYGFGQPKTYLERRREQGRRVHILLLL